MYTEFYNLKEKPFTLSPSSRFLYLGEVHKEALALLQYGVSERKGFILLTGEVGTGKTTMIHALLAGISDETICVHLSNPLLSPADFMEYLAFSVFKRQREFKSKTDFLSEFESFLKKCLQHQKNFILIIDEAHKLSFELLEEIRLLSNVETADEKLINIFLIGQPELNHKLSEPRCRAFLQRISVRYHIEPLDLKGTYEYIYKRLKMAGSEKGSKIFSSDAINAIYQYSQGYPRMINILADNSLLLGYARGTRKISPSMIRECHEDLQLNKQAASSASKSGPRPTQAEVTRIKKPHFSWKWAAYVAMGVILIAIVAGWGGKGILQYYVAISSQKSNAVADNISKERLAARDKIELEMQNASKHF